MANELLVTNNVKDGPWYSLFTNIKYRHSIRYKLVDGDATGQDIETKICLQWQPVLYLQITKGNGSHGGSYTLPFTFSDFQINVSGETNTTTAEWTGSVHDTKTQTIERPGQVRSYVYYKFTKDRPVFFYFHNDKEYDNDITFEETIPHMESYSILFDGNGNGFSRTLTKYYNEPLFIPYGPTWRGYNFTHWNTQANDSGTSYNPHSAYMINANSTLYAQWTEKEGTITYIQGQDETGNFTSQTKEYFSTLELHDKPAKLGNVFLGWKDNDTGILYSAKQILPIDSGSEATELTLHAQWQEKCNITYDFGVDDIINVPEITSYPYDTEINFLDICPIRNYIIKTNNNNIEYYSSYKLKRWYNKNTGATLNNSSKILSSDNITDIIIAAEWEKANLLEGKNATAFRVDVIQDPPFIIFRPNDTGEACNLRIDYQMPQVYKYTETNNIISAPILENAPIVINGSFEGGGVEETFEDQGDTVNSFKVISLYDNENNPIKYFLTDVYYDFTINLNSSIEGDSETLNLNGNNLELTEFLSKAVFTIDISANGDRVGIFKPISDDLSNPQQIEVDGDIILYHGNDSKIKLQRVQDNGSTIGEVIADKITTDDLSISTISGVTNLTTINLDVTSSLNIGTSPTQTQISNNSVSTTGLTATTSLRVGSQIAHTDIDDHSIDTEEIAATTSVTVSSSANQTIINDIGINTPAITTGGDITATGNVTAANIGNYIHGEEEIIITGSNLSVDDHFAGPSFELPAGIWVLSGEVHFRRGPSGDSGTPRNLEATLFSGASSKAMTTTLAQTRICAGDYYYSILQVHYIFDNPSSTYITLAGSSNKAPDASHTSSRMGYLKAVRIK